MMNTESILGDYGFGDKKYDTWVMEDGKGVIGFFTFKHGKLPMVHHFCIARDRRGVSRNAIEMVAAMKEKIGRGQIIIESRIGDKSVQSFIEKCFHIENAEEREFRYNDNRREYKKVYLARI